ncbi:MULTISPECIES: RNA polymerase sigma factor [unclassified Crossiella]|uniref:RNA polymerase sigma factor n=1 Tax=unclassified Crossiella TaxID=2620835 RepID=UPI001FFF9E0F|nr:MULTISPECIES: sigma-70 family RNA polymerase sigma factor [unclassified Crossiella]MCK2236617.1 sigma-70 family RNA polymerase sigma factor [Crossiella sp. S99.2]MCK2250285.1 sigma-70 family RNA polymerase sigma factor [Crossiella sp. S99.1]
MDQERLAAATQQAVVRIRAAGASKEQAEDCVQDAVVDLLAGAHRTPVERPEAWLTTVSRRRFVDQLRRRRREQTALARSDAQTRITGSDPSEAIADRDQARWMAAALDELPSTTREVVQRAGAGMPPEQIATELGLSARSVESHLTRARRLLRRLAAAAVLPACLAFGGLWRWLGAGKAAGVKVALTAVTVPLALGSLAVLPSLPGTGPTPEPPPLALVELPKPISPDPGPVAGTAPVTPAQPNTTQSDPARSTPGRPPDSAAPPRGGGKDKATPPAHGKDKAKPLVGKGKFTARGGAQFRSFGWSQHKSGQSAKSREDFFAGRGGPGRQPSGGSRN